MNTQPQDGQIIEKQLEPMLVAGVRAKGAYEDTGRRIGQVARVVGRQAAGNPLNLYYDEEYKKSDADFESCFPIKKPVDAPGVPVHQIEGGKAVALLYRGPYDGISSAYQKLSDYIRDHHLKPKVPGREVYVKGPGMIFRGNPKNYLTEVQIHSCELISGFQVTQVPAAPGALPAGRRPVQRGDEGRQVDALQAEGLTKHFPGSAAVVDVTFAVPEGAICGFLGPNGAGKTTTVRLFNGVLPPTAGHARVLGVEALADPVQTHRRCGVLTATAASYEHLDAVGNLRFFGQLNGLRGA